MQPKIARPVGIIPKQSYEAALGEFLVSFNQIESCVEELVYRSMFRAGRPSLGKQLATGHSLKSKIHYLKLLAADDELMAGIPFDDIKTLIDERNIIAHGHLEVSLIDGRYTVLGNGKKRSGINEAYLYRLSDRAREYCQALLHAWFRESIAVGELPQFVDSSDSETNTAT